MFTYTVEGTGFLYKQVRGMVGAMLPARAKAKQAAAEAATPGRGDCKGRGAERIGEIVGPDGLELVHVSYGENTPDWQSPTSTMAAIQKT